MGVPCGGWCPEGRRAEDGEIPARYPLTILPGVGYRERTQQNVLDSDATVIIYFEKIEPKSGTEQTVNECIKATRPYLLIDGNTAPVETAAQEIREFCRTHFVHRLNMAGPRGGGGDSPSAQICADRCRGVLALAVIAVNHSQ